MTDDLVKRLRNNCSCNFSSSPCGAEEECLNAFEGADRIEKLEAALRWIVEQERQTAHPTVCAIVKTARKALETEDD
jgi:hypothetical protein